MLIDRIDPILSDDEGLINPHDRDDYVRSLSCYLYGDERYAGKVRSVRQLGDVLSGNTHYYSSGAFDLIHLVMYVMFLMRDSGPVNILMSTYSISERALSDLKNKMDLGDISSIRFLIDNRVRSISPKPFDYLVTSFPDSYRCAALHAKVALIYNDSYHIDIVGSQNATHNPKLERGIIHTDRRVFDFDYDMLSREYAEGTS